MLAVEHIRHIDSDTLTHDRTQTHELILFFTGELIECKILIGSFYINIWGEVRLFLLMFFTFGKMPIVVRSFSLSLSLYIRTCLLCMRKNTLEKKSNLNTPWNLNSYMY